MGNAALHSSQPSAGDRMTSGQYLGVDAVLQFGDPAVELAALHESCGVFHLSWRTKIAVTGKDRARWLHNMVTNNVRDLPVNRGNSNFVLNAQGRILGDIYIYNRGESLTIDTDRLQVEPLLTAMKRFIIMDKVEMNRVQPMMVCFGICGPRAEQVLTTNGFEVIAMEPLEIRELEAGGVIVRGPTSKPGWYEVWLPMAEEGMTGVKLEGAQMVGCQALEWWRVVHGIPQYG